ncbi:MAG TPA: peptidyl-prolyl cis-trans isomerase, partial [Fervidobacterium sp.]|nr:peptidyl-prolyl cis-trans isomerase [Fervidobacterium sp.]
MSKESKRQISSKRSGASSTSSSKVRRVMARWQQVIIWVLAIAFIAGIALWALAVNYNPASSAKVKRTLEETIGYLTVDGTATKNENYWVFPEEIEQAYGDLLAQYGSPSLDPAIEEPYLKTLIAVDQLSSKVTLYYAEVEKVKPDSKKVDEAVKAEIDAVNKDATKSQQIKALYGSISNYEKEFKNQKETELTIQAVKDKLGVVTEDEIKKYYDENKDDLTTNYTKAETQYVTFETKEEMDNFVALAMEKGISQAATESSVILSDYTVTPGTFPEEIEKEIFNATSTIIS